MQTDLAPRFRDMPQGRKAESILRKCVHCGFCTATCPTYQITGDELDGPRGRIYLIKQMLEGADVGRSTQYHLDRCLTCRNCETTCPSGVQYGQLIEIGRELVEKEVPRPPGERMRRAVLREGLPSRIFAPAAQLGRAMGGLVPAVLRSKLPPVPARANDWPRGQHPRKVLIHTGCVQPSLLPNINAATARVLHACGIQAVPAPEAACCGAIRTHMGNVKGGLFDARRNVDAWWPLIESGEYEAIISNASGCGVMVKDWGHILREDPRFAERAQRISAMTRDLSEILPGLVPVLRERIPQEMALQLAIHLPCTLQHGQKLRVGLDAALRELGFDVRVGAESHLCCGSAGTYSVLQPEMSKKLRRRKLNHLEATGAPRIVSANIGCILHLQDGTERPVQHWIEVIDEVLSAL